MIYLPIVPRRLGFVCCLLFIIYLVFLLTQFLPVFNDYLENRAILSNIERWGQQKDIWESYLILKEEKARKANRLRDLESQLFVVSEDYQILTYVQSFVVTTGVQVNNCQFDLIRDDGAYPSQKVVINLTGDYPQIIRFLASVVTSYSFRSFNYSISCGLDSLNCILEIEVYMRPE